MLEISLTTLRQFATLPESDTVATAFYGAAMDLIERHLGRKLESASYTKKGSLSETIMLDWRVPNCIRG